MWLNEIYELNKQLDQEFIKKYPLKEGEWKDKNLLALLVEIGELANEVQSFKYWNHKKATSKELILEEYADVLILTLCFSSYFDADVSHLISDLMYRTIDTQFLELYLAVSEFQKKYTKEQIERILSKVLVLGSSLGFEEQEIRKAVIKKMEIVKKRLEKKDEGGNI